MKTTTKAIFCKLFVLVVLVFSSTMLRAQGVVIKEKVTIDPQRPINTISKALGSSRTRSMEIVATWDAPVSARLVGGTVWTSVESSPLVYTLNDISPGSYLINFQLCVAQLGINQSTLVTLRILIDGEEKFSKQARFYGGSNNIYSSWVEEFNYYFLTDYWINLLYKLSYENWESIDFYAFSYSGNTTEFFPSTDTLTMTVTEGSENISFYDENTWTKIGTICSGTINELNNIMIVSDGILPPQDGANVTIEVSGWGDIKKAELKIYPKSLNVMSYPSQISTQETADIFVGYWSWEYWIRKAIVYIDKGANYGTLGYYLNENSTYVYGDTLRDVQIGDDVQFIANEQEPDSTVEVHITAKRTYYTGYPVEEDPGGFPITGKDTLSGSTTITIAPLQKLKIRDHSPWTLWPYLPPQGRESRGADRPGYNPKRTFTIEVLKGDGTPLPNEQVKIATSFTSQSGGHQHTNGTIDFPQGINQGWFYGQGQQKVNPITLITDADGLANVDSFIASQISGQYLITASLVSDASIKDTVNMQVKVPGLVNFRDLIILNEKPFDFSQTNKGRANHPDNVNTWCNSEMGMNLYLAILDFYEWTRIDEGVAIQTSINDMSLPWGGYFDLNANFDADAPKPSHSFHRVGFSVDINNTGLTKQITNPNPIGRIKKPLITVLTDRGKRFVKDMDTHNGVKYQEDQIHFGFNNSN